MSTMGYHGFGTSPGYPQVPRRNQIREITLMMIRQTNRIAPSGITQSNILHTLFLARNFGFDAEID